MCRLCLFSKDFYQQTGKVGMTEHFDDLETLMGGNGNGCAVMFPSGKQKVYKGVDIDNTLLSEWLERQFSLGARYGLFHTRMATHGSVCYANCHPFKIKQWCVAHNGVAMHQRVGNMTDSEFVIQGIARKNAEPKAFAEFSGVWIGFKGAYPFIVKEATYSDLMYARYEDTNAWMFTSDAISLLKHPLDTYYELGKVYWYRDTCVMERATRYVTNTKKFNDYKWQDKETWSTKEYDTKTSWKPTKQEWLDEELTGDNDWHPIDYESYKFYTRIRWDNSGQAWGQGWHEPQSIKEEMKQLT